MSEPDFTLDQIRAEMVRLQRLVGPKAYVSLSLDAEVGRPDVVRTSCYPHGVGVSMAAYFGADGRSFREAIAKLEAKWNEKRDTYTAETIRKMALAIISTMLDLGSCSDAALRGQGFSQDDIDRLGARACEVANEMAGKGPFEIVHHGASANEPAEAA